MPARAKLQQAAQQYTRDVKQYLQQMLRAGSANVMDPLNGSGFTYGQPGSLNFRYGVTPSDKQVQDWIAAHGGNPYTRQLMQVGKSPSKRSVANALTEAGAEEQGILAQFLEDAQGRYEEANDANKKRYEDILQRLEDRYSRNMDRVDNWGKAAEADARTRANETMGAIQANLSARGLGNSTITEAFRQRNARDLDTQLQRISEARDSRALEADARLSGDIASFMERRTDRAPDYGTIASLAQQYGLSGDGRGYEAGYRAAQQEAQRGYQARQNAPQIPVQQGVSPFTAQRMAAGITGGLGPMANAASAYGLPPQLLYGSQNTYTYTPRPGGQRVAEYAANGSAATPAAFAAPLAIGAGAAGAFGGLLGAAALGAAATSGSKRTTQVPDARKRDYDYYQSQKELIRNSPGTTIPKRAAELFPDSPGQRDNYIRNEWANLYPSYGPQSPYQAASEVKNPEWNRWEQEMGYLASQYPDIYSHYRYPDSHAFSYKGRPASVVSGLHDLYGKGLAWHGIEDFLEDPWQ